MRNIFDQYEQPENRLTHALATVFQRDRSLIRPFLKWSGLRDLPPAKSIQIVEQQIPGEPIPRDADEARGLPDICLFTTDGWVVAIESKVQAGINSDQLARHLRACRRCGFEAPIPILLSVDRPNGMLPKGVIVHEWREVYEWFRNRRRTEWTRALTDYMEVFEAKMLAKEYGIRGTITKFDGLKFDTDHPWSYREGKRLIRLLADDLQSRRSLHRLGVDPKGARRPAITGREGTRVWDFLPLRIARRRSNFTSCPHLTLGVGMTTCDASITVPNGVHGGFRTKLRKAGLDSWKELVEELERRIRPVVRRSRESRPVLYIVQRHFRSQSSPGLEDARMAVDLRCMLPGCKGPVKYQPGWLEAFYSILVDKRSNVQLGVQLIFNFRCRHIRSPRATDLFEATWKAYWPLVDFVVS